MREPDKKLLTFEDDEVQIVTGDMMTEVWLPPTHVRGQHVFTGPREFFIVNGGHQPRPNVQYFGSMIVTVAAQNALGHGRVQLQTKGDTAHCRYFPDRGAWIIGRLS